MEWIAIPFCRGSSPPRSRTWVSCTGGFFPFRAPGKPDSWLSSFQEALYYYFGICCSLFPGITSGLFFSSQTSEFHWSLSCSSVNWGPNRWGHTSFGWLLTVGGIPWPVSWRLLTVFCLVAVPIFCRILSLQPCPRQVNQRTPPSTRNGRYTGKPPQSCASLSQTVLVSLAPFLLFSLWEEFCLISKVSHTSSHLL